MNSKLDLIVLTNIRIRWIRSRDFRVKYRFEYLLKHKRNKQKKRRTKWTVKYELREGDSVVKRKSGLRTLVTSSAALRDLETLNQIEN